MNWSARPCETWRSRLRHHTGGKWCCLQHPQRRQRPSRGRAVREHPRGGRAGRLRRLLRGLSIYSVDCPDPYRRSDPKRKPVPRELQDLPSATIAASGCCREQGRVCGRSRTDTGRCLPEHSVPFTSRRQATFLAVHGYDDEHSVENVLFEASFSTARSVGMAHGTIYTRHAKNVRFGE